MSLRAQFNSQFSNPTGMLGHLARWIMATRPSNVGRNRWTVELLDAQPGDRVLEIGFGPGTAIAAVAERLQQGFIVGLDHSELMVREGERRFAAEIGAGKVKLVHGGLEKLPELGQSFDRVYSVNVMHFFRDKAAVLRAVREVMKPGGLLLTTHMPRMNDAKPEDALAFAQELSRTLEACGFHSIRIEQLPLRPMPAVCVLAYA